MAGIYSALGELDRMRKMAGRRVKDLVTDPLGVLTQQADDLRNTQRGVEPVINAAGAGMRQIPREEQVSRMTQQALDTYAGGLGMLGHTVFHGSPHKFAKFDKAKIGTGEGSQVYGHGLYVAESPKVARQYQAMASNPARRQGGLTKEGHDQVVLDAIIKLSANKYSKGDVNGLVPLIKSHPKAFDKPEELIKRIGEYVDNNPPSFLYKVDIPDEVVPNMLAWDKPLKEQPATVQKALKKLGVTQTSPAAPEAVEAAKEAYRANPSRENMQAMNALMNQGRNIMGSDIIKQGLATEEALQQAGIPGIKYLDAGSREGGGTSNMVVFSPEMMRILERNGEATGAKPWAAGEWGGRAPTEFEARHAAAQRNAALPVEQGGLGLPPNNTAQERAKALGFTTDAYHGTPDDAISRTRQFKNEKLGKSTRVSDAAKGHFTSDRGEVASEFIWRDGSTDGGNVLPLLLRGDRDTVRLPGEWMPGKYDAALDAAKAAGKDGLNIQGVTTLGRPGDYQVTFDPRNIRSRFAAFDPMKRHDADMLGFASPQLLGGMGLGGAGMAAYGLQDDQEGIFSRLGQYLRQRGMQ